MENQLTLFDMSRKSPSYWVQTYFDFDPLVWCEELIARTYKLTARDFAPYIPYARSELGTIYKNLNNEDFSSCINYGRSDVEDFFEWSRLYCDRDNLTVDLKKYLNII